MKTLTLIFLLSFSSSLFAQKSIFVRVYDLNAKMISKGNVLTVTDTSLLLKRAMTDVPIQVRDIGFIKTKRSDGNNVLTGSLIGLSIMGIVGAASANPDAGILAYDAGEGAAAGAIIGLPIGAAIGGITTLFKNSRYYLINGDSTKWKSFQVIITEKK